MDICVFLSSWKSALTQLLLSFLVFFKELVKLEIIKLSTFYALKKVDILQTLMTNYYILIDERLIAECWEH